MICVTGGRGLLGTELREYFEAYAPTHEDMDIRDPAIKMPTNIHLIVHCAAYTDVTGAETNKQECYDTNVIGTRNLARLRIPMIYISTEYVFDGKKGNYSETDYPNPLNFYGFTKLLGEYEALKSPGSAVIRCLFKPKPFEHNAALSDQYTSGDYFDVMAEEIAKAIKKHDALPRILHLGTGKKSTYDLASQTREGLIKMTIAQLEGQLGGNLKFPMDTSLNTKLWESIK